MALRALVLPIVLAAIGMAVLGVHKVDEGHIGMYYVGGKLLDTVSQPGFHMMIPFLTTFTNIQITLQTDTVREIPCGTSGGVMIYFDKIEVVNMLDAKKAHNTIKKFGVNYDRTWIFDRIHHEINQFCSSHSLQEVYIEQFDKLDEALASSLQKSCDTYETGIDIISIRVTKPRIPESVRKNYEAIETAKTEMLVQMEKEKVAKAEESINLLRATMQAQKEAEVASINAQKFANVQIIHAQMIIKEKEAEKRTKEIETESSTSRRTLSCPVSPL
jgi:regulator of protease activity HflC (stomatin/prohibitin superfamily)